MRPARRLRRLALVAVALSAVAVALLVAVYSLRGLDAAHDHTVHRVRLEGFHLQALDGARRPLAEWSGRPLLLNFWASWCKPCEEELPVLAKLNARYPQVAFIGVAIDDLEAVRTFLETHEVSYTILVGEYDAIQFAAAAGNTSAAVPYTAVLNAEGMLIYQQVGVFDPQELEVTLAGMQSAAP